MSKKLPMMDVMTFPVVQPSTGRTIQTRPYLVREEKILLLAQESKDPTQQVDAVAQVVRNCTDGELEPTQAPFFDVEYFLLQLRAKSVGEIATPIYQCHTPTDDGECGHRTTLKINLTEVPVTKTPDTPAAFTIVLTPSLTLHLRYPTIYTVDKLLMATLNREDVNSAASVDSLTDMFESLENTETGEMFDFTDYTVPEKVDFLNSFTTSAYDAVVSFLESMPSVSHEVSYTCERCQRVHTVRMTGLSDFLA